MKKLVLVVIDAMKPAMLERAVAAGRAPVLKRLMEEGQFVDECVAAFPSVTPVCAASIATGTAPDRHLIPHGVNESLARGERGQSGARPGLVRALDDVSRVRAGSPLTPGG